MTNEWNWNNQVTFVPADPPRAGSLVLWDERDTGGLFAASSSERLAIRRGSRIDVEAQPVARVPLDAALEALLDVDTPMSESAQTYRRATRFALELIERGRFVPAVSTAGYDAWQIDPFDPLDHAVLADLAASAPPQAFALAAEIPLDGSNNTAAMVDPAWLLRAYLDAVVDRFVRSAAAGEVAGSHLWAALDAAPAEPARPWTTWAYGHLISSTRLGLRVEALDIVSDGLIEGDAAGQGALDDGHLTRAQREELARFKIIPQLRSTREGSLVVDMTRLGRLSDPVRRRFGAATELESLVAIGRAATMWAPLEPATGTEPGEPIEVDLDGLLEFIEVAEDLEAAGIEVLWPASFDADFTPRLVGTATAAPRGADDTATLGLSTLLKFHWRVFCDGERLTDRELEVLADAKRSVVFLRGRWVRTDPALVERLRTVPDAVVGAGAVAGAMAGSTVDDDGEVIEVESDEYFDELRARLSDPDALVELAAPPGLRAQLRPYQRRGMSWMAELCRIGLGGILADDMGLGKTLQVIALHLTLAAEGWAPTLVIVPTSVLGNWRREFEKFAPDTPVRVVSGSSDSLEAPADGGVVVMSYGVARRNADRLARMRWGLVVADEAQHIKNPRSRVARALREIPSRARIALTGTPVENRLTELWSVMDWAAPGLLGSAERFRTAYVVAIEKHRSPLAAERLRERIAPFMLRRLKTDPGVADDLPPRIHSDVTVTLSAEQLSLYEALVRESLAEIARAEGPKRSSMVFRLLTALKQIANHPAHYLHEADGVLAGRSAKLEAACDLVTDAVDNDRQVLVFSQYVEMCSLLQRRFAEQHVHSEVLHGGLPAAARDALVARFQAGELGVLIISLKAGGTGLNLTAASQVIHFDRWWNPAVEDQATDRAWRIGQRETVIVHRLIAAGTIDERIAEMIERKRDLATSIVGASEEAWITELDDDALGELVELRSESCESMEVLR